MRTKRTRTTEITIEKSDVFVIRRGRREVYLRCMQCLGLVRMLTVEEAAKMKCATIPRIHHWIEIDRVHFVEASDGVIYLCQRSLIKC